MLILEQVAMAYHCDPRQAIAVIREALQSQPELCQVRSPLIGIQQFGDSSIDIGVRYWVPTERYYELRYQANLAIFSALKTASIEIPFPQRDVHLRQVGPVE